MQRTLHPRAFRGTIESDAGDPHAAIDSKTSLPNPPRPSLPARRGIRQWGDRLWGDDSTSASVDAGTAHKVSFATDDGVTLGGHLFGKGTSGVILAHMYPADQTSWYPTAERLAQEGFLVLTFDFRGYSDSEGSRADRPHRQRCGRRDPRDRRCRGLRGHADRGIDGRNRLSSGCLPDARLDPGSRCGYPVRSRGVQGSFGGGGGPEAHRAPLVHRRRG